MIKKKKLTKPFQTFEQQIKQLRLRGLKIPCDSKAKLMLSTVSYYDLVNGYKECFVEPGNDYYFSSGTTIDDLYNFYLLDKGIQSVFIKYAAFIENSFKTALAYVIAKNISEDHEVYLSSSCYRGNDKNRLQNALNRMSRLAKPRNIDRCDNPTKHYVINHTHIPPWILFKNATFSNCTDLASELNRGSRFELLDMLVTININEDYRNDFLNDALATIRRFRNSIAHNLKFVTLRIKSQQRIVLKQMAPEYDGSLLHLTEDIPVRGQGDCFSLILATVSLLKDPRVKNEFFFDLYNQIQRFHEERALDLYCTVTGIPSDILQRGLAYTKRFEK